MPRLSFSRRSLPAILIATLIAAMPGNRARAQALPDNVKSRKDITYASLAGKALKLDVYYIPSATPQPVIIRLAPHREAPTSGGAALELINGGYTLVYASYFPDSTANATISPEFEAFNRFPEDLVAGRQLVQWAQNNAAQFSGDRERIGLWGAGHGASLAALTALCDQTIEYSVAPPPVRQPARGTTAPATSLPALPALSATDPALSANLFSEPVHVRAMCLFEGITDWRNAELYGDESANIPSSPAYQLFGGNPKEHPDDARTASAVNYIRPTSPATLMVTLASDEQRAMHLIFAATMRKAGVPSALYEEPLAASTGGGADRAIDETKLNRTVLEFFNDTLKGDRTPKKLSMDQEIDQLAAAGLYKQARRMIDDQINKVAGTDDAAALLARQPWLKKLRDINDQQQQPAMKQLIDAKKAAPPPLPNAPHTIWTIREVLTDPERIGQYNVEAALPQRVYQSRADAMHFVDTLNTFMLKGDYGSAERQANVMHDIAAKGDADPATLNEFTARFTDIRGKTAHVWPPGIRTVSYAFDNGQDIYGYWMDVKLGGELQRFRYIPAGRFTMGSKSDEWGRLPNEQLAEATQIAKGFWLGESPVTQAVWEAVMGKDANHSAFKNTGEVRLKLPAENLSYAHAVNFLNKLAIDARLPTEAEYEYALRAGSTGMVAGTGRLSDMAWFWDEARSDGSNPAAPTLDANGEVDVRILHELETDRTDMARLTHPVKTKLPNRWGLYDMQGNVWEWCSGTSPDKPRDFHPVRGGSWASIPQSCRAARDAWFSVEQQSWNIGLRICITAQ